LSSNIDKTDLSLLAALERDGRLSFRELADQNGLSKTPCWNRIQRLEQLGVIGGYHAELNAAKMGLGFSVYVQVTISPQERDRFEEAVLKFPSIIECITTTGFADYILKLVCSDVAHLDLLLREQVSLMPGVQKSTSMICMKVIKSRGSIVDAVRAERTPLS
jgi:Lrp/AsnC family leucine-responsive transcriptional regulator